jgi:hypothetical protein
MRNDDEMDEAESSRQPSSAGRETVPLTTAPADPDRRVLLFWLALPALLVAAAALLMLRYPEIDTDAMAILMTIGGTLLFFAFWRRLYGLMIPGLILICLSFGVTLAQVTAGEAVLWSLSAAFLLIAAAGRTLYHEMHNWPLLVAGIIAAVAAAIWLTGVAAQLTYVLFAIPLVLVTLGLYLGFWRRR